MQFFLFVFALNGIIYSTAGCISEQGKIFSSFINSESNLLAFSALIFCYLIFHGRWGGIQSCKNFRNSTAIPYYLLQDHQNTVQLRLVIINLLYKDNGWTAKWPHCNYTRVIFLRNCDNPVPLASLLPLIYYALLFANTSLKP